MQNVKFLIRGALKCLCGSVRGEAVCLVCGEQAAVFKLPLQDWTCRETQELHWSRAERDRLGKGQADNVDGFSWRQKLACLDRLGVLGCSSLKEDLVVTNANVLHISISELWCTCSSPNTLDIARQSRKTTEKLQMKSLNYRQHNNLTL